MKVIIDLHAIKGSQNGWEHSGTRDGYQEWGDSNVDETVQVIDFLAERLIISFIYIYFYNSSLIFARLIYMHGLILSDELMVLINYWC